jgi:uncharacterized protein YndB with AHSA1/START domain/effector-binding domain-containing protein
MRYPNTFTVTTPTDREIVIARSFAASRELMFDAFTKPELVRRWLLGPDGWTMPVCEIDLRLGGAYRYVWRKPGVKDMGIAGQFLEIVPSTRLVNTERFDDAWYPGEATNTTTFTRKGAATEVTITVRYESTAARDIASRSGMERGMAAGFDRLEALMLADEAPHIIEAPAQMAAAVHLTVPRSDMRTVVGPALREVMNTIAAQGIEPSGAWFTHHFEMKPDTFDFDICVPVSTPVTPEGRVVLRHIPAMTVARAVYRGPYEGLSQAWGSVMQWMDTHGHVPAADLFECYAAGPETGADSSEWRTELSRPLHR